MSSDLDLVLPFIVTCPNVKVGSSKNNKNNLIKVFKLVHSGQDELTKQCLSAVKLPFGDGGWVMGAAALHLDISIVGNAVVAVGR